MTRVAGEIVVYAMAREGEELAKMEKAKGGGDQRSEKRNTTWARQFYRR